MKEKKSRTSPLGHETTAERSSNNSEVPARPLWLTYLMEKIESLEAEEEKLSPPNEPERAPSRKPRRYETI